VFVFSEDVENPVMTASNLGKKEEPKMSSANISIVETTSSFFMFRFLHRHEWNNRRWVAILFVYLILENTPEPIHKKNARKPCYGPRAMMIMFYV